MESTYSWLSLGVLTSMRGVPVVVGTVCILTAGEELLAAFALHVDRTVLGCGFYMQQDPIIVVPVVIQPDEGIVAHNPAFVFLLWQVPQSD